MKSWLPGFNVCAARADLITVSTQHLKLAVRSALGKECPPVEVVENAIDFDLFKPIVPQFRKNKHGMVTVGWAGTNTHTGDTRKVFDLMLMLLREEPSLQFEVAGIKIPKDWEAEFGDRIKQRDFVPVAEFASNWASWQWDISLAPVEQNEFNLSKSNIKGLEAAALSIPCVMSNVGEYIKFATYSKLLNKTVLANSISDWKRKIMALVKDAQLREQVGQEMNRVGKQYYDVKDRVGRWQDIFDQVVQRS
jgi:glycosyltransferase involved in cell wall biosynthesis